MGGAPDLRPSSRNYCEDGSDSGAQIACTAIQLVRAAVRFAGKRKHGMTIYFDAEGIANTEQTAALAAAFAEARSIGHIVVATSTGSTARELAKTSKAQIVAVTHANGYPKAGENELPEESRKELTGAGIRVLTTSHALSGAERAISNKFGGAYPLEIVANTLRLFGQGTKVAVEIAVMALDSGFIPYGVPIISIGGTNKGADTALLLVPSHAASFFDTRIQEVICKPR